MSDCDIDLALQATIFGAVGTCGQRCTSLRRVFIQKPMYKLFKQRLINNYPKFLNKMGDPLNENTLLGPLHSK